MVPHITCILPLGLVNQYRVIHEKRTVWKNIRLWVCSKRYNLYYACHMKGVTVFLDENIVKKMEFTKPRCRFQLQGKHMPY